MSENRLADNLDHMLEAARQACSYIEGIGKDDFLVDKRTQQAVILNIVIIGEAATKLLQNYGDFLERHPDLPWRSTWKICGAAVTIEWDGGAAFQLGSAI